MAQDVNNLIWVDLEMTGLDVSQHTILEMAMLITDKDLNVLGQWPAGEAGVAIYQPDSALERMNDWSQTAHTGSGLVDRVRASSMTLKMAEEQALAFIWQYCPPPSPDRKEACPLAGNSVSRDRDFLRAYMPALEQYTSYRNVDVSTLKELVKRWYPEHQYVKSEIGKHGAMVDILASIDELRHYRARVFKS